MIRTFCTNEIRKTMELNGQLWRFSPCSGEHAGKVYPVVVPCCWENFPDFPAYRGIGIFEREFQASGTVRLVFQGVSHTARVCVDGVEVATHYNAYTPFAVVVKDLEPGTHKLEVYVDNSFSEASALHIPNDYMTYGGITRSVWLEELKDAYVEYVHAIPKKEEDGWKVRTAVKIHSVSDEMRSYRLELAVEGAASVCEKVTLGAWEEKVISGEIAVEHAEEWSMENPRLYGITATLWDETEACDDLKDRFGFREIRVEGKNILLNGKKVRIKGFCRHEDHPMFGCALPIEAMQQDLLIIRDLGGNAVRTSHYPNDERFLDLCDEQGILVWEENHARGMSLEQMQNPNFEPQAENCIREMIIAHMNHPSIIIWGILNECASHTEYGYACYKKQYDLIQELDTSRPRSSASNKFEKDLCLGMPEIVSYNMYPEWYDNIPAEVFFKEQYDWLQENSEGRDKPFLVAESGAGAIYGYRVTHECKWSEEYQAKTLEHQIRAAMNLEGCSGLFIWQFCDTRITFERFFAIRPRTMNNKGIVDEYRRRKMSYDIVKKWYHSYSNYME